MKRAIGVIKFFFSFNADLVNAPALFDTAFDELVQFQSVENAVRGNFSGPELEFLFDEIGNLPAVKRPFSQEGENIDP